MAPSEKDEPKSKSLGGRPKIPIDWEEVAKLAQFHCTAEEIAWFFKCTAQTLENRCQEDFQIGFLDFLKQNRGLGKYKLRKKRFDVAMSGNVPMLIWLSKQILGESEKSETLVGNLPTPVIIETIDGRTIEVGHKDPEEIRRLNENPNTTTDGNIITITRDGSKTSGDRS